MTEEQRQKRNAYMREWSHKNRDKVKAYKSTPKALAAGAELSRNYRASLSPEEKARQAEYKRQWAKSRTDEYKEAKRLQLREYMRSKRATPDGRKAVNEAVSRYRDRNREQVNARCRERRKNPTLEQRQKKSEMDRLYRLKWTEERKAADRERTRRLRRENPDRHNANNQRRRALKKGSGGNYTAAEWSALKEQCGFRCLCCGRHEPEIKLTVDHVAPLISGGTNDIGNIQPLCVSCNASKQARTIDFRKMVTVSA